MSKTGKRSGQSRQARQAPPHASEAREARGTPATRGHRSRQPVASQGDIGQRYWPCLLIAAIGFIVFANSLRNGFVYDDVRIIRDNPRLESPWNPGTFFSTPYFGENQAGDVYRPLAVWSFAVDRAVFGPGPFGVHLVNVVANIVAALLMYVFLLRLLGRPDVALLASVVFVVHPIHTEVVANGVGRAELHCAIAVFAACIAHLAHIRAWGDSTSGAPRPAEVAARPRAWGLLGAAMALYLAGLLFKETAVTLPALVFAAEWLIVNDGSLKRTLPRIWRYAIYAAPLALFLAMRASVIGKGLPAPQEVTIGATPPVRMLFASGVLLRYVGQMIFPVWMSAEYSDYNNPVRAATGDPVAMASLLLWPALAVAAWWWVRRRQWVPVFGIAWFLLSLLPTSNILFSIGTIRADRLLYLPSAGFCLLAAWGVCSMPGSARRIALVAAGIWVAALSGRAIVRNADWRSAATLWPATIKSTPGSAVGWSFIGDLHRENGETTAALECYTRAVDLRAKMGVLYPEASNFRAQMLVALGRRDEAADVYRGVLRKYPQNFVATLNLGELLMHDPAKVPEALNLLRRAIQLKEGDFRGHGNLAQALLLDRQTSAALVAVERAIALSPAQPMQHELKARILDAMGRQGEAKAARARRDELQRAAQARLAR